MSITQSCTAYLNTRSILKTVFFARLSAANPCSDYRLPDPVPICRSPSIPCLSQKFSPFDCVCDFLPPNLQIHIRMISSLFMNAKCTTVRWPFCYSRLHRLHAAWSGVGGRVGVGVIKPTVSTCTNKMYDLLCNLAVGSRPPTYKL